MCVRNTFAHKGKRHERAYSEKLRPCHRGVERLGPAGLSRYLADVGLHEGWLPISPSAPCCGLGDHADRGQATMSLAAQSGERPRPSLNPQGRLRPADRAGGRGDRGTDLRAGVRRALPFLRDLPQPRRRSRTGPPRPCKFLTLQDRPAFGFMCACKPGFPFLSKSASMAANGSHDVWMRRAWPTHATTTASLGSRIFPGPVFNPAKTNWPKALAAAAIRSTPPTPDVAQVHPLVG
jgi:hypothetical protein